MRRTATALCGAVLVTLLAACGQSSLHSGSAPGDYGDSGDSAGTAQRPARPDAPRPVAALVQRVRQAVDRHSSVRFSMTVGRSTVRGTIALRDPVAVRSTLAGPGRPAGEVIQVGAARYLTSPRIVATGIGTPWTRLPAGTDPVPYDSPAGLLRRSASAAPAAVLDMLRAAGTLTGGADPYAFRIDLRRLTGDPLRALAGREGVEVARTVLRLDDAGLPQRVRTVVELPGGPLVTTIRYGAWDAPADIAAPAPDRIATPTGT